MGSMSQFIIIKTLDSAKRRLHDTTHVPVKGPESILTFACNTLYYHYLNVIGIIAMIRFLVAYYIGDPSKLLC